MGTQISAVTLGVKDLARAKRFYEAIGGRFQKQATFRIAFYKLLAFVLARR